MRHQVKVAMMFLLITDFSFELSQLKSSQGPILVHKLVTEHCGGCPSVSGGAIPFLLCQKSPPIINHMIFFLTNNLSLGPAKLKFP
eukprot:c35047_g1_i1 orf=118-375(-)